MLQGSLHFHTLKVQILKVLTLCQSVKVKQRYLRHAQFVSIELSFMFGFFQKAENDMENLNKSMKHLGIFKKMVWYPLLSNGHF